MVIGKRPPVPRLFQVTQVVYTGRVETTQPKGDAWCHSDHICQYNHGVKIYLLLCTEPRTLGSSARLGWPTQDHRGLVSGKGVLASEDDIKSILVVSSRSEELRRDAAWGSFSPDFFVTLCSASFRGDKERQQTLGYLCCCDHEGTGTGESLVS